MALSGIFSNSYRGYTYRISWQGSHSIPENCTKIQCTHELVCAKGYDLYIYSSRAHSVTLGDSTVGFTTSSIVTDGNETLLLGKTTHTVYHSDDGSGSFELSAIFSMKATIAGVYTESIKVTGAAVLDTISRASTLDVSGGTLGVKQQLTINRYSGEFRHSLTYSAGTHSGTLISPDQDLLTVGWTPIYSLAENASGKETVTLTFTLITYSDSTASTIIGSEETAVEYRIPQNLYTLPDVTVTAVADNFGLPAELSNLYIQGLTKVRITVTEQAKEGATIASRSISFDGRKYGELTVLTPPISSSGDLTLSATVADSRGFVGSDEKTITVLPYSKPYPIPTDGENTITCKRISNGEGQANEGDQLLVKIKKKFSPLTVMGVSKNRGALSYRYKTASSPSSEYSTWVTLLRENDPDTFDDVIPGLELDGAVGYSIQFRASDLTGNDNIITLSVPSEAVTLHLPEGGEGLAVGMFSENGGFEVGFDSHFYGNVHGRVMGLGGVPSLNSGTDLNDCKEYGIYCIPSNTCAETILNIPIKEAGTLRVWSGLGVSKTSGTWVYIVQDYINFTGRKRYSRYIFTMDDASTWTVADWVEI
ncbi:MAG: hypothetical protein IKT70_06505 [Clostridia bacterium]|nr:hypothetical protein [Clostridia bacterium]